MENSSRRLPMLLFLAVLFGGGALLLSTSLRGTAPTHDATVSGNVTIDGQLASGGTVTFHPAKGGQPATGNIQEDGTYSLRSGQGNLQDIDGGSIPSGEYVVTVSINANRGEREKLAEDGPPLPGPSLIAAKYRKKETTDLKQTIKPGANVVVLSLEAATAEEQTETDETEQAEEAPESVEQFGDEAPVLVNESEDEGTAANQQQAAEENE